LYGGNDEVYGGRGNDTLFGGSGSDKLGGGYGNDRLVGDEPATLGGNDFLYGEHGHDVLFGYGGVSQVLQPASAQISATNSVYRSRRLKCMISFRRYLGPLRRMIPELVQPECASPSPSDQTSPNQTSYFSSSWKTGYCHV